MHCRILCLGLLRLNIKARHDLPELLDANLLSIHLIAFNGDLSWSIFTLHSFCSLLVEQLIDLRNVRTEILKFRTDLQDQVIDGRSVTQYKGRLLKNSSTQKSKLVLSTLVTTWLSNIAFHLQKIWLQTLVAVDTASCHTSFPSFCTLPSEVAVLFDKNLSRRPFLGQVVNLDLLLCTGFNSESEHAFLFHVIYLLRDQ